MKALRRVTKKYYVRQVVACFLVSCLFFNIPAALATPSVADDGGATVGQVGNTTSVTLNAQQTIMQWNSLDTYDELGPTGREFLEFLQAGGITDAAVLNKVISGIKTQFNGTLTAHGIQVFIVNQAGIVFGPASYVQARTLVASALDIDNQVWKDGIYNFSGFNPGSVGVQSLGEIDAEQGVALIGNKVLNSGSISAGPDGFVVMAAGDTVLLGEPGSDVVVKVESVPGPPASTPDFSDGDVVNEAGGEITADGVPIVLAAGDVFSTALPTDSKAVRVSGGVGRVLQNGIVDASSTAGDGGAVSLTAGNEVVLGPGSQTKANAFPDGVGSVRPIGGQIFVSSPETVTADPTAHLEAKGNGFYDAADNGRFDIDDDTDFRGSIRVEGSFITPPSGVDLSAWSGATEEAGFLTVGPYEGDLIIANGAQTGAPAENTIYEEWIEQQSDLGVNVDLLAPEDIIAQTLSVGTDPGLEGGSGDMSFRTVYDSGSITFDEADMISTDEGGNIFMLAGKGGITVGDIKTDTASSDKATDSGQIFLLTTRPESATEGGDITTGSMEVVGGGSSEISAIAAGTLTVNGDVTSIRNQVPKDEKAVGKALICLIADEDIIVHADVVKVEAHGKFETNADICISAGWDVHIAPTGSADITAQAKTSERGPYTADARVVLHAGWNKETKGTISINGINYNDQPGGDNSALPVSVEASVSGIGGPARVTPADPWDEDDPHLDPDDGTHKFWKDENTKDYGPGETARATATLEIDNKEELPPSNPLSPCYDCPRPPFLPPIPAKVIVWDDDYTISKSVIDYLLDVLANDDDGQPLVGGAVVTNTDPTGGGTLKLVFDGGKIVGFEYTPPADADYLWDGVSDYAVFTDTFTYKAEDAEGNVSVNTATVTISVQNFLPVGGGADILESKNVSPLEVTEANPSYTFVIGADPDDDDVWIVDDSIDLGSSPGSFTPIKDGDKIIGFEYTPDLGAASFDPTTGETTTR
ncbi:MAG: filamentous hemagglutinin N-terminal domain-containing protein [Planctomycetota bacterium]|jgi:filamentous hemagglutinin family protein